MLNITAENLIKVTDGELLKGDLTKYGDTVIHTICYDSRIMDKSSVFVPLKGDNVDSHKFICQVLNGEGLVCFSEYSDVNYEGDRIIIKVDNTVLAVKKLAQFCRNTIKVPIIGVTGSVGKTSTREMISLALSAEKTVYATPGNRNSQLGTPQSLSLFVDNADIAVLEMGVSMPGDMSNLADMVKPDSAVFTNIGITHIEYLGSREAILNEKAHITDYMKPDAPLFINNDNDLLSSYSFNDKLKVFKYGIINPCDAYATDIEENSGCPSFTANVLGEKVPVKLNVYGKHNIYNALVSLLVCSYYGVDLQKAACKLETFKGYLHRGQILHNGSITIIDDTYNASPDSVKAAIDMLSSIQCSGRRIAVLGDMKELGDNSVNEHISIGEYIESKNNADILITYGDISRNMSSGIVSLRHCHFEDEKSLEDYLYSILSQGDLILFKGSNSMRLFDIVDKVMKHEFM